MLARVGIVIGLAAAWGLTRLMASDAVRREADRPDGVRRQWQFCWAVAFLASYLPARRALG